MRWLCLLLLLPQDTGEARQRYPPHVTRAILEGRAPAPEGFDKAMTEQIGRDRLDALRRGAEAVTGRDNDVAASVLLKLGAKVDFGRSTTVRATGSTYKVASGRTSGVFKTGQDADIALSAIGFNDAGGPLMFNHPMGIASDGRRLLLTDTYNNRVLVWSKLPEKNEPPDLVLGQKDFTTNDSGTGRDQMNWPVTVATDGTHVAITDTENVRILIWNAFPTKSGQAADLVIHGGARREPIDGTKRKFFWPWGVWTDGTKLAVSSTQGGRVLIWNVFPTRDDAEPDLVVTGGGHLGTPRMIVSDGKTLIVGDHNPRIKGHEGSGTFFWKAFPTKEDAPCDFFMGEPGGRHSGTWLRGNFMPDGKLVLLGQTMHIWNTFPEGADDKPDLSIRGYDFRGGDHVTSVWAGGRLYVCTGNLNKVVVFNALPARADARPDFAIGAPDLATNTLDTRTIISNPVPASNGRSLFVASDFDRRLYVWKSLPDESGAAPDFVYDLPDAPWGIGLWKETLALAGKRTLFVWKKLPLAGEKPDVVLRDRIGSVKFQQLLGVAIDDDYCYVSDTGANKVHVWKGLPTEESEPAFSLPFDGPGRVTSDGTWLAIAPYVNHGVHLYRVKSLGADAKPETVGGRGVYNILQSAQVVGDRLFIAETGAGRVHAWKSVEDAIAGKRADVLIGSRDFDDFTQECARDKLHTPAAVWFDGVYLWVGETKFSERLLRFSPSP